MSNVLLILVLLAEQINFCQKCFGDTALKQVPVAAFKSLEHIMLPHNFNNYLHAKRIT